MFRSPAWPLSFSEKNFGHFGQLHAPHLVGTVWSDRLLLEHDQCAPVHKARTIKTWMTESSVDQLDWRLQSPDLNPNEHPWDDLKRTL